MSAPALRGGGQPDAEAVVLVLHGGGEQGRSPVRWTSSPTVRMMPFAWAIDRAASGRLSVVRLKNAVFGWNEQEMSPVRDARWALDQIRRVHPGRPIALVGHSMGGRVALRLAGERDVVAVVGLAPWVHESDEVRGGPGLRALLLHGDRDRTTDPRASESMARAMRARGVDAAYRTIPHSGHAMLLRAPTWHRAAATYVRDALLGPAPTS